MTKKIPAAGTRSKRGFASMSPEKRREIAAMGGRAVPAEKRSFYVDPSTAAKAGRKGGSSVPPEKRTFSKCSEVARKAGVRGGTAAAAARRLYAGAK